MADGTAEKVHPRKYSAGRNDILELQGDRRISVVAGHPHRSHPTGVWVLPEFPQDEGEVVQHFVSQQTVAAELQDKDDILFRSLVMPKYSFQHRNRYTRRRMAFLKLSLMAFSFIFWIAGLAMLTVGIWAKISLEQYLVLSTNSYPNTPLILLVSGPAVLLWGFLGCFSAAVEKRCLLRIYGFFQLAVLLAGLAAGLSSLFYRRDIADGFQSGLRNAVLSYAEDEEKANALDAIQRNLQCCGVHSYRDWFESPWSLEQQYDHQGYKNGSVPSSCCQRRKGCRNISLFSEASGIHREGCFKKVCDFVSDNMFYIATVALGLALMQVIGIVLSCLLANKIPLQLPEIIPT
ncbi:PREDICTED: tetraspanin-7-like [Nanorana parkeri]|uniref:tetraspanin-7-like n=1 Tax=Nanorana parkeri TaxID=125878 RepID=UPI000854F2F5|nr:PREDICTED: tetraspanin-7-like [Nanorana parkeri]